VALGRRRLSHCVDDVHIIDLRWKGKSMEIRFDEESGCEFRYYGINNNLI